MLAAASASLASSQTTKALGTLRDLGFLPNLEKSVLSPVQKIEHLGLVWDSVAFTVSVPEDKLAAVQRKCRTALSSEVSVRFLSSILGSIEFFRWGFPYAAVHYRALQRFVNACLADDLSYDSMVFASPSACRDLQWWADSGSSLVPRPFAPFSASFTLYSDASLSGWGGWTSDNREAFGHWSPEKCLHINVLELQAVNFLFRCLFASHSDCSIAIRSDNSTVVAYINHQGGPTSTLCDLALDLWSFCIDRDIRIHASHLGGVLNCRADSLSRLESPDHSYFLLQEVFDSITALLPFGLFLDCFASRLNAKLSSFVSRYADPLSSLVDAFAVSWHDGVYLFPPVPLLGRVLSKFLSDGVGHGLLICPFWPSQPWFSTVLELLIDSPFLLPSGSVVDEARRLPRHSRLLAYPIGSHLQKQREFRDGLQFVACGASSARPLLNISEIGDSSTVGFIDNRQITVRLL